MTTKNTFSDSVPDIALPPGFTWPEVSAKIQQQLVDQAVAAISQERKKQAQAARVQAAQDEQERRDRAYAQRLQRFEEGIANPQTSLSLDVEEGQQGFPEGKLFRTWSRSRAEHLLRDGEGGGIVFLGTVLDPEGNPVFYFADSSDEQELTIGLCPFCGKRALASQPRVEFDASFETGVLITDCRAGVPGRGTSMHDRTKRLPQFEVERAKAAAEQKAREEAESENQAAREEAARVLAQPNCPVLRTVNLDDAKFVRDGYASLGAKVKIKSRVEPVKVQRHRIGGEAYEETIHTEMHYVQDPLGKGREFLRERC